VARLLDPPRSPDLNPCDFFLWGHLQNFVYAAPIANLEELTERINAAVNTINVPMLQRVQQNIVRRAALCIEVGGRNFEQLLFDLIETFTFLFNLL
jgi:hypothetical protein